MKSKNLSVGLLVVAFVMVVAGVHAAPPPLPTPDAGSTGLLMTIGVAGLAVVKRFMR